MGQKHSKKLDTKKYRHSTHPNDASIIKYSFDTDVNHAPHSKHFTLIYLCKHRSARPVHPSIFIH